MKRAVAALAVGSLLVTQLTACAPKSVEVEQYTEEVKETKTEVVSKEDEKREETIYNLTDDDKVHREDRLTGKYKWYLDNRNLAFGTPFFETYAFFDETEDRQVKADNGSTNKVTFSFSNPVMPKYADEEEFLSWHELVGYQDEVPSTIEVYLDDLLKIKAIKNFNEKKGEGYFSISTVKQDGTLDKTFNFPFTLNKALTAEYTINTTLEELTDFEKTFGSTAAKETLDFLTNVIKVQEEKEKVALSVDEKEVSEKEESKTEEKKVNIVIANIDLEKSDEYVDNVTDTAFVKALVSLFDERGYFGIGSSSILVGDYNYYEGESNIVAPNSKEVMKNKSNMEIEKWQAGLKQGLIDSTLLFTNLIKSDSADYSNTIPTMERIELTKDKVGEHELELSRFEYRYNTQYRSDEAVKKAARQVTVVKKKIVPKKIVE